MSLWLVFISNLIFIISVWIIAFIEFFKERKRKSLHERFLTDIARQRGSLVRSKELNSLDDDLFQFEEKQESEIEKHN